MIATAMPPADSRLPFLAVAGEFMRMRPRTNATAPVSQAIRTSGSRMAMSIIASGLRLVGRLRCRDGLPLEHLEHPVGDHVATDDVHRREGDRDERQDLAEGIRGLDGD